MNVVGDSMKFIGNLVKERGSHILVAFSGGKDSRVVLDMAVKCAKKVTAYFLYYIPDLQCTAKQLSILKERWPSVELVEYPLESLFKSLKNGRFRPISHTRREFEEFDFPDIEETDTAQYIMQQVGANFVLGGWKKADFMGRKEQIRRFAQHGIYAPLAEWNKQDVLLYLNQRHIPIPEVIGGLRTGDISTQAVIVCWLHDFYPDDYEKLLNWFPFAEAIIWRRKFYGIPECKWQKKNKGKKGKASASA